MTATELNPSTVAAQYLEQVRADVDRAIEGGRRRPRIVGLLGQEEGPAATYARYARRGAEAGGIELDVRLVTPEEVEPAIAAANTDADVDGVFLYYPLRDRAHDRWLRELVDPRKDVEGMHSFWARLLYENQRFVDDSHSARAILPCTPLAILKLLQHAGMRGTGTHPDAPLEGVTACVINRSDLVGRPLAAMLANDGAVVHSLDVDGSVTFEPAIGRRAFDVQESGVDRATALAAADVVISAVPSRDFDRIRGDEIREGAICVDVAEFTNFDPSVRERASVFVPRVGPLTIAMAARNLTRLIGVSSA